MKYQHTQHAPLGRILVGAGLVALVGAVMTAGEPAAFWPLAIVFVLFTLLGSMFDRLTVSDEGSSLAVRFGPLPLFQTRIEYQDIESVELDRTAIIDGWGIHYIPWRGTTWNLWGFDCVKLRVANKTLRLGTDDAVHLAEFLVSRLRTDRETEQFEPKQPRVTNEVRE